MATSTPWGTSQGSKQLAPGIVFYSTAGHGGIHLSAGLQARFEALFPDFKPFAGGPWYEEDCDCNAIVIAFPENFSDDRLTYAVDIIEADGKIADPYFPQSMRDHIRRHPSILQRAEKQRQAIADLWEVGGMSTGGDKWSVCFTHRASGQRVAVTMEYPNKRYYSRAELEAMGAKFAA